MSVPESRLYEQFVDRTLSEVALGLQLDNAQAGSKKRKVHDALVRRSQSTSGTRGAAQKIIESRFILGGDDASYLTSGLACLWSTVGAGGDGNGAAAIAALSPLVTGAAVHAVWRSDLVGGSCEHSPPRDPVPPLFFTTTTTTTTATTTPSPSPNNMLSATTLGV